MEKVPQSEFEEIEAFKNFLVRTGRMDYFNRTPRGEDCLCIVRDFSALVTRDNKGGLSHLHNVDVHEGYKGKRAHAVIYCDRCQLAFDAMLTFEGERYRKYFPESTQKVLERLEETRGENHLRLVKLPAPASGTFSNKSRLVLATPKKLTYAIDRFNEEILGPLGLEKKFTPFDIRTKEAEIRGRKIRYFQGNTNPISPLEQDHFSIRALQK